MKHLLYKFTLRLMATKRIWFGKYRHFFLVSLTRDDLIELIKDEDYNVAILTHGMRDYNVIKTIKCIADKYDDEDMILMKAEYEADALNK